MSDDLPLLHVYGQGAWHDEAAFRPGLTPSAMVETDRREALMAPLRERQERTGVDER